MKTIQRIHRLPRLGDISQWVFRVVNEDKKYFMLIQQWTEQVDGMICFLNTFSICDDYGNILPEHNEFTVIPTRFGWIDEMQGRGYKVLADFECTPECIF